MSSPIAPDSVYHLKSVADPALSPDGRRLAYSLGWVEHKSGRATQSKSRLMMTELDSGEQREFTQGAVDTAPKFSPDGGLLAFLRVADAAPPVAGGRQIWVMDAHGGEARRVTNSPKGVFDYSWSPDGQMMAYCADVDPAPVDPDNGGDPEVTVVGRVRYRYDTVGWRGDSHFHIFIVGLDGGVARQITDGDWDDTSPVWSPDGTQIAFASGRRDDRDLRALSEIYVVPAEGGAPVPWSQGSQGLVTVGAAAWSPEGDRLVVVGSDAPEGMVLWQGWLYILEPGQVPRRITDDQVKPYLGFPAVSRQPEIRWTNDGRVLFLGETHGESFILEAKADSVGQKRLWGGACLTTALTLDQATGRAVTVSSTTGSPGDLHRIELPSGESSMLTDHNRGFLQAHPPARAEKFWVDRPDSPGGYSVECRLLLPPDFDESGAYPLVLDIHGGPNGAFYDSYVAAQQVLATSGYLVLAVNPRGSSTYGNDFMLSVLGDWGGEDYLDLMAAVDEVAKRPYVDTDRLGIHGYSYGGYMTSWTVGHTSRFKAAVVGAPCINLHSMYGTSDIGISFGEAQWGGSLVDATDALLERSPITYASQVDTPVLLLHGEADARCPIGQSEEYFSVLRRLGKEVEFVRFPGCSHLFPRVGHPKMREEYLARTLKWFNRYLG